MVQDDAQARALAGQSLKCSSLQGQGAGSREKLFWGMRSFVLGTLNLVWSLTNIAEAPENILF